MKKITFILFLLSYSFQMNAQDTCLSASVIIPGLHTVAAVNGTEIPDPICAPNGTGATVGEWYSYTPAVSGVATVTTNLPANAGGDTRLHIYTGVCGALVCYANSDDVSSANLLSEVTFQILNGTTYYIAFDNRWDAAGFDFDLLELPISCLPTSGYVTNDITATTLDISWTDNNTGTPTWEIEYGAAGFAQGAGTLDAGITAATHSISGLTANTEYEFYIRTNCGIADGDSTWDGPIAFRTIRNCAPYAVYPYSESFVDGTVLDCWAFEDVDASGPAWGYNTLTNDLNGDGTNDSFMVLFPQSATELVKNDWMFSPKMGMIAGTSYNISTLYNGFDFNTTTANESFELIIVDEQSSTAAFQSIIGNYSGITQSGVSGDAGGNDLISQAYTANETFTPTTSGVYYVAIRATSTGSASLFMVFNISVNEAILIDIPVNWTGATNTDWATQTNWSTNVVPKATDIVVIPNVTNKPVISSITGAVANNITIDASSSVSIQSGGSLIIDGIPTVNGDFIYNVVTGDENWHLVSSPVVGEEYGDLWNTANNISTSTDNANEAVAYYLNTTDADGDWKYYEDGGAAETFISGIGYALKSSSNGTIGSLFFTGSIPFAPVTVPISAFELGGADENRWNLVGNPFPAYFDVALFLEINNDPLSDTHEGIYVWNPDLEPEGAYEAVTTGQIHPGQGFFVSSNVASTAVEFTASMQAHELLPVSVRNTADRTSNPQITVTIGDGTNTKSTEINYLTDKTTGLDPRFDIGTFTGQASSLNIYTHLVGNSAGVDFTRQALPNSDYENMIIPIGVSAAIGKEITFTANDLNLPTDIKIFLEDRETNTFRRLDEANSNYKMTTTEALNGIGRFYLHASRNSLTTKEVALENVSVYKIDASTLRISGLQNGSKTNVTLFNLLGKQIVNTSLQSNGVLDVSLPELVTGVYIVKIQTAEGTLSKKIILE
jgi:hypothetical protein